MDLLEKKERPELTRHQKLVMELAKGALDRPQEDGFIWANLGLEINHYHNKITIEWYSFPPSNVGVSTPEASDGN